MQFVNLTGYATGTTVGKTNHIIRLESRLEQNIANFINYYNNKSIKYNNKHTLSQLCNNLMGYVGVTPEQTYDNVRQELRYICNLFGVAYPGIKQAPEDVLLGKDILVYKEGDTTFINGLIDKHNSIMSVQYHDQVTLRPEDYLSGLESNSIISLDIPLLASQLHQETIKSNSEGNVLDLNKFITQKLICGCVNDLINLALINRFELDSLDISYPTGEDNYISMSYRYDNVSKLYDAAKSDYKDFFKSLTRTQLSDVYLNLPLLNDSSKYHLDIKDYYLDSLMWLNAVSEVNLYNKLTSINSNYNLKLNLDTYDNRLKKLLGRGKSNNLVSHLPDEQKHLYGDILKR